MSETLKDQWNEWKDEDISETGQYITNFSTPFLQQQGWMYLAPMNNDGYLYTRPANYHSEGSPALGHQVGDMRIKFEYVPCSHISVVSQQMQNPEKSMRFTFRQWNPKNEFAEWGEDNGSDTDATCPVFCLCCFLVEKFFKMGF